MLKSVINSMRYGWDAGRVIRLSIGLLVLGIAAYQFDKLMMVMGGWLVLLPLLNVSCCGTGGCDINHVPKSQRSGQQETEVTSFEEVKTKS